MSLSVKKGLNAFCSEARVGMNPVRGPVLAWGQIGFSCLHWKGKSKTHSAPQKFSQLAEANVTNSQRAA